MAKKDTLRQTGVPMGQLVGEQLECRSNWGSSGSSATSGHLAVRPIFRPKGILPGDEGHSGHGFYRRRALRPSPLFVGSQFGQDDYRAVAHLRVSPQRAGVSSPIERLRVVPVEDGLLQAAFDCAQNIRQLRELANAYAISA